MKKKSLYTLCVFFFFSIFIFSNTSCQRKQNINKDDFIEKYQIEDFSKFSNSFIAIRSKGIQEVTYMIHEFGSNLPTYFVTYNCLTNSIINIDNTMLKEEGIDDYYTEKEISDLIIEFRKYDFYLLGSDNEGNVLINPYEINQPAFYLRSSKLDISDTIRMGYVYERYKDNWYINTQFIHK